ncbi:MAG TPA: acetate--CoA ligase family protein [Paraburkholderia sp.]
MASEVNRNRPTLHLVRPDERGAQDLRNDNDANSDAFRRDTLKHALLAPRSIALIGQSDDASKTTGRPLRFLRQAGYTGRVYPVNPKRDTVLGERAWPSLDALPEAPDHAYILTPTDMAIDSLEACAKRGIPVATVLAAGFSETGAEGAAREARVARIVQETGIRVLGPSCLGIVNLHEKLTLTANAAFAEPDLPVGGIFAASHSGSMIGALVSRGKARGIGYAGLVSVGNEVDLSLGEICSATLDDPRITGYMLFLETLRHADALRRFAFEAAQRGKPVIAYKLGRSSAAAELAVSHTGALAGEDDIADAFLKDCGIARVGTLEALFEGLPLLASMAAPKARLGSGSGCGARSKAGPAAASRAGLDSRSGASGTDAASRATSTARDGASSANRSNNKAASAAGENTAPMPRRSPRVAVVTTTGGAAAMVVDQLGVRGISVEAPSAETQARLAESGVEAAPGRIVDLTLAGVRYDVMSAALRVLRSAPEFDLVIAVAGSSARFNPDLLVRPIIDSAQEQRENHCPLASFIVPDAPLALAELTQAGVPCFRTPEACADAVEAAFARRAPATPLADESAIAMQRHAAHSGDGQHEDQILDELDAYTLLRDVGLSAPRCITLDATQPHVPDNGSDTIHYPVVAKVLSAALPHKSDVGGVVLNITDDAQLLAAVETIRQRVAASGANVPVERILVQPMVHGIGEVLIGYRVDAQVGPIVMLAAGGVLTEIYRDRALRLAPIDRTAAFEMIDEVRALKALGGYRGKPRGDLEALADALVALSQLATKPALRVLEAEINPLIVRAEGEGVVPVDALVRVAASMRNV